MLFIHQILICIYIFKEEESRLQERLTYSCKCSFLEIYNEHITDLLEPSSTNLQVAKVMVVIYVYMVNVKLCK